MSRIPHHASNPSVTEYCIAHRCGSSTIKPVSDGVRIGILGDFNTEFQSHHATTDSLQHAARKLQIKVESEWLPTTSLTADIAEKKLESFDALWAAPG